MPLRDVETLKSLLVVHCNASKAVADFSIPVLHKNHRQFSVRVWRFPSSILATLEQESAAKNNRNTLKIGF